MSTIVIQYSFRPCVSNQSLSATSCSCCVSFNSIRNDSSKPTNFFAVVPCEFDITVSNSTMNITSPGWPKKHETSGYCAWNLRTQTHGFKIKIVFHEFSLEQNDNYVKVRNIVSTYTQLTMQLKYNFLGQR